MKKPMKTLTVRLDEPTLKKLAREARRLNMYTTTLARELIMRGVDMWNGYPNEK